MLIADNIIASAFRTANVSMWKKHLDRVIQESGKAVQYLEEFALEMGNNLVCLDTKTIE